MLNVRDIFKSLEFYQEALGFRLVSPVEEMIHFKWASSRAVTLNLCCLKVTKYQGSKKGLIL